MTLSRFTTTALTACCGAALLAIGGLAHAETAPSMSFTQAEGRALSGGDDLPVDGSPRAEEPNDQHASLNATQKYWLRYYGSRFHTQMKMVPEVRTRVVTEMRTERRRDAFGRVYTVEVPVQREEEYTVMVPVYEQVEKESYRPMAPGPNGPRFWCGTGPNPRGIDRGQPTPQTANDRSEPTGAPAPSLW